MPSNTHHRLLLLQNESMILKFITTWLFNGRYCRLKHNWKGGALRSKPITRYWSGYLISHMRKINRTNTTWDYLSFNETSFLVLKQSSESLTCCHDESLIDSINWHCRTSILGLHLYSLHSTPLIVPNNFQIQNVTSKNDMVSFDVEVRILV